MWPGYPPPEELAPGHRDLNRLLPTIHIHTKVSLSATRLEARLMSRSGLCRPLLADRRQDVASGPLGPLGHGAVWEGMFQLQEAGQAEDSYGQWGMGCSSH